MCCVNATYLGTMPFGYSEAQRNLDRSRLAVGMQMDVEMDLRIGSDQSSRIRRENIGVLSDRVFVEEQAHRIVYRILNQVCRQ